MQDHSVEVNEFTIVRNRTVKQRKGMKMSSRIDDHRSAAEGGRGGKVGRQEVALKGEVVVQAGAEVGMLLLLLRSAARGEMQSHLG